MQPRPVSRHGAGKLAQRAFSFNTMPSTPRRMTLMKYVNHFDSGSSTFEGTDVDGGDIRPWRNRGRAGGWRSGSFGERKRPFLRPDGCHGLTLISRMPDGRFSRLIACLKTQRGPVFPGTAQTSLGAALRASCYKRFFANARPEGDFRYFSKALACSPSVKATAVLMRQGRNLAVCGTPPSLCFASRAFRSSVNGLSSHAGQLFQGSKSYQ